MKKILIYFLSISFTLLGTAWASSSVRINEAAPNSTPDWVEFFIAVDGNYSNYIFRQGSTIIQGSTWTNTTANKTFPNSFNPSAGDYIVLHFNASVINSSEDDASGKGANGVWDFYTLDSALTATDNVLTLRNSGDTAPMIDAMAFSNRNGSWTGNSTWFTTAVNEGQWTGTAGEADAADWSTGGTNKSIGRDSSSTDTETKNDWAVQASTTPGYANPPPPPPPILGGHIPAKITEVAPGISGGDFVELYVTAESTIVAECTINEGTTKIKTFSADLGTISSGTFIVLWASKPNISTGTRGVDRDETSLDENHNSYIDLYSDESSPGLTGTDNNITLKNADSTIVDFMSFADNGSTYTATESAYDAAVTAGQWSPAASTEAQYIAGSFAWDNSNSKSMSRLAENVQPKDTNTKDDWIEGATSPGGASGYSVPTLSWTGETNYISDGLDPETGTSTNTFTFKVKYISAANDAPKSGYPKVHIKKGGVEISSSPFTMSKFSGNYNTGAIYTYSKSLTAGSDYTYYFEAQDSAGTVATGDPITPIDAPDIVNNIPTLSWTGEPNFTGDGLDPETGTSTNTFTFKMKYTDIDKDAPLNSYPKLYIKKSGVEISSSPFTMTKSSGDYDTGAIYSCSVSLLARGTDYIYYFEAKDAYNDLAVGEATGTVDAPDVLNVAPELSWIGEPNYLNDGINPEFGDVSTTFYFKVKYRDPDGDAPKPGYPRVHILKGGVEISGSPLSMPDVPGNYSTGVVYSYYTILSTGTDYIYYFDALDSYVFEVSAIGAPTSPINGPRVYTKLYSIKGQIQSENYKQDILVNLTGASFKTYTTTSTGYYEFLDLEPATSYIVTPQRADLKFEPSNRSTPALLSDVDDWNFTGTIKRFSISGCINKDNSGMSSVTVVLSGSSTGTYITAVSSNGYYQFTDLLVDKNYTVTPSKAGYVFSPVSISTASLWDNLINQNFTGALIPYYIKGNIKGPGGLGVIGVTMSLSGTKSTSCVTGANGNYEFLNITLGDYTVTPSKLGWKFIPPSRSYQQLCSNTTNQNFSVDYNGVSTTTVSENNPSTIVIVPETGEIKIEIPDHTFSGNVLFSVSTITVPSSEQPIIKPTKICIEIKNDRGLQPNKKITISICYVETDIVGFDEAKLRIARYDEAARKWILLPSTPYPDDNRVVGTTDHLSKFALVQLAAASNLKTARAYPVPFHPKKHINGMIIENLTSSAGIKLYTISGDPVRDIEYTDQTGRTVWDGKNDSGNDVASGIYMLVVKNSGEKKILKIVVER